MQIEPLLVTNLMLEDFTKDRKSWSHLSTRLICATFLSVFIIVQTTGAESPVLFIHSAPPILTDRVVAELPHHQITTTIVGMSFGQNGRGRRTWMIKSSNSMLVDNWVQEWIFRKWQADLVCPGE
jgi:hypothetical protein